jgi:hypothetical protein
MVCSTADGGCLVAIPTCDSNTGWPCDLTCCMYHFRSYVDIPFDIQVNQAANGVTRSYDALVDLLESIEHFLSRLDIYTRITPTPAMDETVVKIMMEVLTTFALATKEIKQGRSSERSSSR